MVPDDDSMLGTHLIRTVPTLQDVRLRKPCFVVEVSLHTQESLERASGTAAAH